MRLCISTGIFPPDVGGPATYVPAISRALAARGHHITVITLSDSEEQDDTRWPFRVIRLRRSEAKPLRLARAAWHTAQLARQADLIYANGLFLEAVSAARLARKPLVMKVVGDWAWEKSVGRGWLDDTIEAFQSRRYQPHVEALKTLRSTLTRQAEAVITPSRYLRRMVAGWGVLSERLHVIYNAQEAGPSVKPARLPPFEGPTLVSAGRLVPWKGIDHLLRVVADLPQARLVVVGDGPQRASLQSLASSLGLKERVMFTGWASREEVASYLRAADVFVLNSTYEGLPHIVLEAMQAGVPVVATDVGGTGELIQHGNSGLLVRPNDEAGLQATLQNLLAHPNRRKELAESGRRRAAINFSFDTMVSRTERLLTHVSRVERKTLYEVAH